MAQIKTLPYFLDTETSYEKITPDNSPFKRGLSWGINANGELATGTGNGTGEGQNEFALTPTRANVELKNNFLPEGYNKNVGTFESLLTKELYYFNYNEDGKHGIYVISGDDLSVTKVIIDENLGFTDTQENYIAEHRVTLRVTYDENKNIIEKHLIFTDGNGWQKWINVIASIKTDGFNESIYPYWTLQQPHFDRRELIEYAPRPSMIAPLVDKLPNTNDDKGLDNRLIDTAFQFCYEIQYTDGRYTTVSPYSLPYWVKSEDFLSDPDLMPKKLKLELYAGSCMVEKITIYVRQSASQGTSSDLISWGNWYKYDVINKFTNCGLNDKELIGNDYWLRQNAWDGYNYNQVKNTIEYVFKNDKLGQIVDQNRVNRIQNDMPIRSVAMSDLGDGIILANNEYGFDNFTCQTIDGLDVEIVEGDSKSCNIPLRTLNLYVYAGRDRAYDSNDSSPRNDDVWLSQFGYKNGNDKKVRWGGIWYEAKNQIRFDIADADHFNLNFGDNSGFRCYLKGTPYFSECEWYSVDNTFNLKKVEKVLDAADDSDKEYINSVFSTNGFFVGKFTFQVPAGKYIATIGRHDAGADFTRKSTYIMGIANSRNTSNVAYSNCGGWFPLAQLKTVKPNAIVSKSKEIELDCTNNDIDLWGKGADLFYVCTPFQGSGRPSRNCSGSKKNIWRFVEGYLTESDTSKIPIERFNYTLTNFIGHCGDFTDKNGFFWGYSWGGSNQDSSQVRFSNKINCANKSFLVKVNNGNAGAGWYNNLTPTLADYNNGEIGINNRIKVVGTVRDLTGTIGYANIAVTMKDSGIAYTKDDGSFTLILHNGTSNLIKENIYFNAVGNFNIIGQNCQPVDTIYFDEGIIPCNSFNTNPCDSTATELERYYPVCIDLRIVVDGGTTKSIKTNGRYEIGLVGADLAGRVTYVNKFKEITIPSFLKIDKITSFGLNWLSNGNLQLPNDIKWAAFYVSKNVGYKKYLQWIGDSISYIDSVGNVTTDSTNASLAAIKIDSLLQSNIKSNFSLFANYQFQKGDRLRILDNGEGKLLSNTAIGEPIDLIIEGTNYNEAAISAGLLPQGDNVVISGTDPTTIIVKYTPKLDELKDKKGFWIELYNNDKEKEQLVYYEVGSFYPVINGEIAEYKSGYANNAVYSFLTKGVINYWDTYLFKRTITIPNVGNKYISHPFESQNITDKWGANIISGGRANTTNDNAKRRWYLDDVIRSGDFVSDGLINNLATYLSSNRKSFKGYKWGGIVAVRAINSYIFFLCENDYFTTDYNYHYARPNAQGVMVVNLDNDISQPHQKIGNNYGCDMADTQSIIMFEDFVGWHDRKNGSYIMSDYRSATEITKTILSYYSNKSKFVSNWNETATNEDKIDTMVGIDMQREVLYISFRPRRNNTDRLSSFINNRRNLSIDFQETLLYDLDTKKWIGFESFVPEAYGKLRGNAINNEMITFQSGKAWKHLNTPNDKFNNFYNIDVTPCLIQVVNTQPELDKVLQYVVQDTNNTTMWVDEIYTVAPNSFSYVPLNYFVKRQSFRYATVLRDGASYPIPNDNFRNMLFDGKKLNSPYFVIRYVWDKNNKNEYGEINNLGTNIIPLIQN